MSAREVLLAAARRHMWAAWQLSSEELASQAAETLLGLGMLVPEGGAQELERLRAEVAALRAERHVTNEALDDAVRELRARNGMACRACGVPVSWVESVTGGWWQHTSPVADGHGITPRPAIASKVEESAAKLTALLAPSVERPGEFEATLHHGYAKGRDLPEAGVQR